MFQKKEESKDKAIEDKFQQHLEQIKQNTEATRENTLSIAKLNFFLEQMDKKTDELPKLLKDVSILHDKVRTLTKHVNNQ